MKTYKCAGLKSFITVLDIENHLRANIDSLNEKINLTPDDDYYHGALRALETVLNDFFKSN